MVITPDSKVKLIKNPLKLDSNNEMMFANATAQYNYFISLPKLEFDNLTYIRKDNILKIETDPTGSGLTYEDLLQYNFCMYQNTHFDSKWFYAFITDITWINPSLTELKLETAYFQTWQFDLIYMDSFIEREHVNDDTIGLHTIPEGLETGEYVCNSRSTVETGNFCYVIGCTKEYDNNWHVGGGLYNGVYSGKTYYYVMTSSDLESFMEEYDGRIDDIAEIFLVPRDLIGNPTYDSTQPIRRVTQSVGATLCSWIQVVRPNTIDNYTPKNNKLLVYPYQYLLVDNNAGGSAEFYYELFKNPSLCKFNIQGVLTPGTSRVLVPEDYAYGITGITGEMYNYGLSLGKFPICNWTTDVYTNWLTQNGVNMQWNLISSIGSGAVSGAKTGGIAGGIGGAVGGGISGVINNMLEKRQHSFSPNQAKGNANSGDVMTSLYANMPYFLKMSIKQEYAKQIDSYFSMFGYQTNRLGKPHLTARTYYDYIKTVDVNLEGNVPEPDLNQIRNMFNNGIRFWHDTTKYLDFSVNNTIVT